MGGTRLHQQTFAEVPFEQYRKPTPGEQFLSEMNCVVPWRRYRSMMALPKGNVLSLGTLRGTAPVRGLSIVPRTVERIGFNPQQHIERPPLHDFLGHPSGAYCPQH